MTSAAFLDGWHSHKGGLTPNQNPYNETSQAASFSEWLSGWVERFSRHKHDKDGKEEFDFDYGDGMS